MTERWRRALGRLDGAEPDRDRIRSLAEQGPRMPADDGGSGSGRRVLAAAVALAVAAGSFALVVTVFRGGNPRDSVGVSPAPPTAPPVSGSGPASPTGRAPALDPAAVCDVPTYDPAVTLLVGNDVVEYPKSVLEEPGVPASSLDGPPADALVARLADPKAGNAPTDGWREIASAPTAVTFAAPLHPDVWWVEAFEERNGVWRMVDEELADRRPTAAQRGHHLELRWDADLVFDGNRWNQALTIVNDRASTWIDDGGEFWADAHVFDRATGEEVALGEGGIAAGVSKRYEVLSGDTASIPVALGPKIDSLSRGTYELIACIPALGLASPVGTLRVDDTAAVDIHVLTYHFTGAAMTALAFGKLADVNGCLALEREGDSTYATYVLWPEGYALVQRNGRTVLLDPVGNEVAALGDDVSLGGGGAPLRLIEDNVIGGVPDSCRTGGEGYFITSGLS